MFVRSFLAAVVILLVVVTVGANAKKATLVPTMMNRKVHLQIRGGAGPLDPETIAKVFTAVGGAGGLLMAVAPKLTGEMYGFKDCTYSTEFLSKLCGVGGCSYCIMMYCLFFQKTSIYTALQAANVFWIYEHLGDIFNDEVITKGCSKNSNGQKFALAVAVVSTFAMTQDYYADTVIKVTSVFWGLSGLWLFLAPKHGAELWQLDSKKMDAAGILLWRLFGCFLLATSAFMGSIAFCKATNLQATGYGSIAWAMWHVAGFLRGDFKQLGMNEASILFWLLFHSTVIVTTLL